LERAASLKTLTVDFVLRKMKKITEDRYGNSHKGTMDLNTVSLECKAEILLHFDCPVRRLFNSVCTLLIIFTFLTQNYCCI